MTRSPRLSSPPPMIIRVPSAIRFLAFCQPYPDRAVICSRSDGKVRGIVRPAEPAIAVDRDRAGFAVDAPERGNSGLDGALRMVRIHALHDAGSQNHPDNLFAVTRQRNAADAIVGIKAAARQRRIADPAGHLTVE